MKVFVVALGSGGDLDPFLAICIELRRRGNDVTLLGGAWHERVVREAGLGFHAVLSAQQFDRFIANAEAARSTGERWVAFFYHVITPAIAPVFDHVAANLRRGDTLLLGASQAIGLRLLEERLEIPFVTVRLQPQALESDAANDAGLAGFDRIFTPILNRHRRRVGLAPIDRPFDKWLICLERAIALFPPWFIDARVDAPQQGRMFDFLFLESTTNTRISREMDVFLARHDPPVVFTHGTGNRSVKEFFQIAIDACASLGKAAILLTKFRDHVPQTLPREVLHADYVRLDLLLPYADALAYHGGIGTCAQALRAGTPQLVTPIGFDQQQNAARVQCLGVGALLNGVDFSPTNLREKLVDILQRPALIARCRSLSARFQPENTVGRCCDIIDELARG